MLAGHACASHGLWPEAARALMSRRTDGAYAVGVRDVFAGTLWHKHCRRGIEPLPYLLRERLLAIADAACVRGDDDASYYHQPG